MAKNTRARILQAAADALVEGRGELEMGDVARRAEVSAGLAYHYFGSKAGLLGAVVSDFYDRYDAVANRRYDREVPWGVRERQRLDELVRFLYADPLAQLMLGRLSGSAEVAAVEAERRQSMIRLATRNVADGQRRGHIPADLDARTAGAAIVGGVRQAVVEALSTEPAPEPAALAEQLWGFIAGGLRLGG